MHRHQLPSYILFGQVHVEGKKACLQVLLFRAKISVHVYSRKYIRAKNFGGGSAYTYPVMSLLLNGSKIEQVTSYRYLGVTITEDLSWGEHINLVCCKRGP